MAPARKKSRLQVSDNAVAAETTPDHIAQSDSNTAITTTAKDADDSQGTRPAAVPSTDTTNTTRPALDANNRSSWYSAAAWRSKASPVAQVAHESISVDRGVSSESSGYQEEAKRRPSQSVSKSFKGGSRKSIPLVAEPTRVHAVPGAASMPKQRKSLAASEKVGKPGGGSSAEKPSPAPAPERKEDIVVESAPLPPVPQAPVEDDARTDASGARPPSGSWFGWWSRPDGYGVDGEPLKSNTKAALDNATADQASDYPLPPESPLLASQATEPATGTDHPQTSEAEQPKAEMSETVKYGSTRSWFGLWSSTQNQQAVEEEQERRKSVQMQDRPLEQQLEQPPAEPVANVSAEPDKAAAGDLNTTEVVISDATDSQPKSSGWAFWSKDKPKGSSKNGDENHKEVGELAVADTPSQSHPEAAQFNEEREPEVKRTGSLLRRGRPKKARLDSVDATASAPSSATPLATLPIPAPAVTQLQTPKETPEGSPAPVQRGKMPQTRPNLILPSFRDTYPLINSSGYLDKLTQYIGQTLHISSPQKPAQHPYITTHPHKVRKAIAIGVHGFFPAALIQRVLGQPTGTSIRFANYAAASVKQWCQEHQPEIKDVEVEKVALEGEGLVADRVNTLWKLLLNWLSQLRQADFIFVACHSQGVPVAIMLVAKLIQLGVLSPKVRIGVCAMAGINLGPFMEYKSRFFGGSALELFDFCDSKSRVSYSYSEGLEVCLRHGVRVTFVGGLDDQLVSLESSLHMPLNHPYVSRTIFIDGRLHTSNFLIHLVTFAAKLRNLGVSDHGLIREISAPLAGSIVGGEGHSRVYDDLSVYRAALEFALETSDVSPLLINLPKPTSPEEQRKSMEEAVSRRGTSGGYPANMTAANHMRRGSLSSMTYSSPGIAPVITAYEVRGAVGSVEKNPFVLPWAVRGMLEEELVKRDPKLQREVKELVQEFEEWQPTTKVLKDVRWRLEGVRSML